MGTGVIDPVEQAAGTIVMGVVSQPTHDNLNLNANIQVGDVDVSTSNPVPVLPAVTGIQPVDYSTVIANDNAGAGVPVAIPLGVTTDTYYLEVFVVGATTVTCLDPAAAGVAADAPRVAPSSGRAFGPLFVTDGNPILWSSAASSCKVTFWIIKTAAGVSMAKPNYLVFRPNGASDAPNVFTSWAVLYAQKLFIQGPCVIELDATGNLAAGVTIPAGTYALHDVALPGHPPDPAGVVGNTILHIADTAYFTDLAQLGPNLTVDCQATTNPTITMAGTLQLAIGDNTELSCSGTKTFLQTALGGVSTVTLGERVTLTLNATECFGTDLGGATTVELPAGRIDIDTDVIQSAVGSTTTLNISTASAILDDQTTVLGTANYVYDIGGAGIPLYNTGARFYNSRQDAGAAVVIDSVVTSGVGAAASPSTYRDHVVDLTAPGARTVTLPDTIGGGTESLNRVLILSDGAGTSGTPGSEVTVSVYSDVDGDDLINGSNADYVINTNYGAVTLVCVKERTLGPFVAGEWRIIGQVV